MKNKTPALRAEVLCKALPSGLHKNSSLPTCRAQRATGPHAFTAAAASTVADCKARAIIPKSGLKDCRDALGETGND